MLLSPVTGAGYATDSASCSRNAALYIKLQMRRAVTISVNTATVLNEGGLDIPTAIKDRIGDVMDVTNPIDYVKAVFTGGQLTGPNGQLQQISGIGSYSELLPNFDSSEPPATNGADVEGNLVLLPSNSQSMIFIVTFADVSGSSFFVAALAWGELSIRGEGLILSVQLISTGQFMEVWTR